MRTGEIRRLKWSYVDRKAGFIRLPASVTKENKEKNIPINHHVKMLLNTLPQHIDRDFIIVYRGKPIREKDGLKKSFKSACESAKIANGRKVKDGLIFHDIRRTVKTNMVKAGVDKVFRDTILGHSIKGMDIHYIAPSEADLIEAMDRYTQFIDHELEVVSANVTQMLPKNKP